MFINAVINKGYPYLYLNEQFYIYFLVQVKPDLSFYEQIVPIHVQNNYLFSKVPQNTLLFIVKCVVLFELVIIYRLHEPTFRETLRKKMTN